MDEDFPRGTASRPSTRSADGKKTKTKCFVQLGVKRGVEDVLFKESEQETPSKGKKRKTKKNDGGGTEEEPNIEEEFEGMVENEGSIPKPLSAKTLNEGMLLLAVVQEIHEYEIVLSLPNGLTAFVQITDVSSFFTQQLQEMNESSNADDQDLPNIQDLYKVGNLVPCKIKSLTASKDGHRRIQASLDYKEVNSELGISFIKPGMTLNGCVSSVEDHGYTIDLGIRGTNAFLAKEDSTKKGAKGRKGETMKTGKLVTCLVKAVKANGRSIILTFDAERLKSCKATKTSHTTFSSLIPGTKMDAMVTKILPNSLILDIFGLYKGCVDPIHLKDSADELTKYSIGQKLTAVVVYNCPTTKSIGLSLNPAHHKVTFDPAIDVTRDLSPGDIIKDALVVRVQAKENVILQLNTKTRGIVYHSHFSDDDKQKRQSPVSVGEKVGCRILSFNLFDRLAIVSLKKSILDKPFLGINDVQPGLLVKGVIESVVPRGVAVKIQDRIHGFVPRTHLADIPVQKPQERFTVGSEIELRVLLVEPAKRRVLLTHKKTMVKSSLPILSSYSQPKVGMWVHGCVVAVKDFGCIVSFYNDVKGIIPRAELGMDESSSPTDNFYVGQVLKCRVLRTHSPESKKLSLSLKKDGRLERESFEAGKTSSSAEVSHSERIEEDRQMEEPEVEFEEEGEEVEKKKETKSKKTRTLEDTLTQIDYFREISESLRAFACMMVDIKVVKIEMNGIKEMLQELTDKKNWEREKERNNDGQQKDREIHVNEIEVMTGSGFAAEDTRDTPSEEQDKGENEMTEWERKEMDVHVSNGSGAAVDDTRDKHREERDKGKIETIFDVTEHAGIVSDHGESESDDEAVGFHDVFGESGSDDDDGGSDLEDAEHIDKDSGRSGDARQEEEQQLGKGETKENIGFMVNMEGTEFLVEDSGRVDQAREEEDEKQTVGKSGQSNREEESPGPEIISTQREVTVADETSPREGRTWKELSDKMICNFYESAKSMGAFSKMVMVKLVDRDILVKSNCYGKAQWNSRRRNIQAIDPDILKYVLETTYDAYGVDEADREKCRQQCVSSIDSHCRYLFKDSLKKRSMKKSKVIQSRKVSKDSTIYLEYTLDRGTLRKAQSNLDNDKGLNSEKKIPLKVLSDKEINHLHRSHPLSRGKFATQILKKLVSSDVLINSNCSGKTFSTSRRPDVQAIDPDILEYVLKTTYDVYGVDEADREKCRKECFKSIDAHCRYLVFKLFQTRDREEKLEKEVKEGTKKAKQNTIEGRRRKSI